MVEQMKVDLREWVVLGSIFAVFAGLSVLAVSVPLTILDYDTFQRLSWVDEYDWACTVVQSGYSKPDTHVLYHGVLNLLTSLGLSAEWAIRTLNGLCFGGAVALLARIARREGHTRAGVATLVFSFGFATPGITCLVVMGEDNIGYLLPLLLVFDWLSRDASGRRENVVYGLLAGAALCAALATNVTALVLLFGAASIPALWLLGQRTTAVRWVVMLVTALALYAHLFLTYFPSCPAALPYFFEQAISFQDDSPAASPLLSLLRVEQVLGGLRAMAVTPTVHRMSEGFLRMGYLEVLLPLVIVTLCAWIAWVSRGQLHGRLQTMARRPDLLWTGLLLVAFPIAYEAHLVERWDMAWVFGFWLIAKYGTQIRVPMLPMRLLVGAQGLASVFVVLHHVGVVGETERDARSRQLIREARAEGARTIAAPMELHDNYGAFLQYHLPQTRLVFVDAEEAPPTLFQYHYFRLAPVGKDWLPPLEGPVLFDIRLEEPMRETVRSLIREVD